MIKNHMSKQMLVQRNYNKQTNTIRIPIIICLESKYGAGSNLDITWIETKYSSSNTIGSILDSIDAMKQMNSYHVYRVDDASFVGASFYIHHQTQDLVQSHFLRSITEFTKIDIISHGFTFSIIAKSDFNHRTKQITIPITAYDHNNIISRFSIYAKYRKEMNIAKILNNIQSQKNIYVLEVVGWKSLSRFDVMRGDPHIMVRDGLELRILTEQYYNHRTKQIKIPITTYDHNNLHSNFSIYMKYSHDVNINNILSTIKNQKNVYIAEICSNSFCPTASKMMNRPITDFDKYSIVTAGLRINIINAEYYNQRTKQIKIPVTTFDHNSITANFSINMKYSNDVNVDNILSTIQNQKNVYVVQVLHDSFCATTCHHNKSITDFDPYSIVTKGLAIKIINGKYYNHRTKQIKISVSIYNDDYDDRDLTQRFTIHAIYAPFTKIRDLLEQSMEITSHKFKKKTKKVYSFDYIRNTSFCRSYNLSSSITNFKPFYIVKRGLSISIRNRYTHKVTNNVITCKHLQCDDDQKSMDPTTCPIYCALKNNEKLTRTNYHHLWEFSHFKDEYNQKPVCEFGLKCHSFIALEDGGNSLYDQIHIKLYRHPPRHRRQINLAENMKTYILNTNKSDNTTVYAPTSLEQKPIVPSKDQKSTISKFMSLFNPLIDDKTKYKYNDQDGYILALIAEVINNGFKYDLCMQCTKKEKENNADIKKPMFSSVYSLFAKPKDIHCSHDVSKTNIMTLLEVVKEKLNHPRHIQIGSPLRRDHMLALLLYTAGDCNYDLCKSQREGNYTKWKWFDFCLYEAIKTLNDKETGEYKLFSGLTNIKMDRKLVREGYFVTYMSTSWQREVANGFINGTEGMLIEVDEKYRGDQEVICCDVSWISKFINECEVLIARSIENNRFSLCILDQNDGIQIVGLRK